MRSYTKLLGCGWIKVHTCDLASSMRPTHVETLEASCRDRRDGYLSVFEIPLGLVTRPSQLPPFLS
jgi:hypothetical protein